MVFGLFQGKLLSAGKCLQVCSCWFRPALSKTSAWWRAADAPWILTRLTGQLWPPAWASARLFGPETAGWWVSLDKAGFWWWLWPQCQQDPASPRSVWPAATEKQGFDENEGREAAILPSTCGGRWSPSGRDKPWTGNGFYQLIQTHNLLKTKMIFCILAATDEQVFEQRKELLFRNLIFSRLLRDGSLGSDHRSLVCVKAQHALPEQLSDRKHWQKPPTASGFVHEKWSTKMCRADDVEPLTHRFVYVPPDNNYSSALFSLRPCLWCEDAASITTPQIGRAHPGQEEVHLQLGHASAQTRPHSEPKGHRPERVLLGLLFSCSQPPFRLEDVGVGEDGLIVGHAVVAQVEERLWEARRVSDGVTPGVTPLLGSRASHLFGEEVISHHDLVFNRDPSVSRNHRIQPGDHRTQGGVSRRISRSEGTCQKAICQSVIV